NLRSGARFLPFVDDEIVDHAVARVDSHDSRADRMHDLAVAAMGDIPEDGHECFAAMAETRITREIESVARGADTHPRHGFRRNIRMAGQQKLRRRLALHLVKPRMRER